MELIELAELVELAFTSCKVDQLLYKSKDSGLEVSEEISSNW